MIAIPKAIQAGVTSRRLTTLREDGIRLCLEALTSVEEIRRVTGDRLA
jgi:type II secretory ATPase GspE/PulE/Tfp pilus assembly ATPase PilB-like protein